MRLTLLALGMVTGLALSTGAQAAPLTLLHLTDVQTQSLAQTIDYREDRERAERRERFGRERSERCEHVRHECREAFVPGSWRFRRCVAKRNCG